jgi:flagellar basal-body rod protein FlgC
MLSSVYASVSGIKAAFKMLDVSAHNTANMDTDGFKKETAKLEECDGGVVVNIGKDSSPGAMYQSNGRLVESSNVNYADDAVSRIISKHYLSANIAAFKTADEMVESLLDIKA